MRAGKSAAAKLVTTFGTGLACAYLAPSAEGAIVSLTANPGSAPFIGGCFTIDLGIGGAAGDFTQCNDGNGKSIFAGQYYPADIAGFRLAPASQSITTQQTFGNISRGTAAAGTETFGFLTNLNQVGWIKINFGGSGGPVTFLAAAYNDTPGGSIHAGSLAQVPEPTSLALLGLASLALGSRGVRRLRDKTRVQ